MGRKGVEKGGGVEIMNIFSTHGKGRTRDATGGGKYAASRKSSPVDRYFKNKHTKSNFLLNWIRNF